MSVICRLPLFVQLCLSVSAFLATEAVLADTNLEQQGLEMDWAVRILALGGAAPAQTPVKFGEGYISRSGRYEYGTTFSPDGMLFFFGVDLGHRAEIRVSRWREGRWSDDEVFLAGNEVSYNDPMMSASGQRLYFITDKETRDGNFDIAYVERTDDGWSSVQIAADLATARSEYFWSESTSREQFFARDTAAMGDRPDFDIFSRGTQTPPAGLALPGEVNSRHYQGDPFVLPDGKTLVFVSNRPGGVGKGDLYVSHRTANGEWNAARTLGAQVNTPGHEITPYVTPNGRWLLFSRDGDIYWSSATHLEPSPGHDRIPEAPSTR